MHSPLYVHVHEDGNNNKDEGPYYTEAETLIKTWNTN